MHNAGFYRFDRMGKGRKKPHSFAIHEGTLSLLRQVAKKKGKSMSKIVSEVVELYLTEETFNVANR